MVKVSGSSSKGFGPGREEILSGAFEARAARFLRDANIPITPAAERLAIKRRMLADHAPGDDVWVFGYGSLIWNPAFHYAERRVGRLHGLHRRFVFWSTSGRGSPERPGMMLALEPGGSCGGVALRIAAEDVGTELDAVFLRELMTASYNPRWVRLRCDGEIVRAIAFVANRAHRNYAGRLPLETVARHLAEAEGGLGTCRDYLANTATHLKRLGIRDSGIETLTRLVEARLSEPL